MTLQPRRSRTSPLVVVWRIPLASVLERYPWIRVYRKRPQRLR